MASLRLSAEDERDVEFDPAAVSIIRQNWIDKQLKKRELEFTEYRTATVFCGTYNVNAKVIADEDVRQLEAWLFSETEKPADIFAVGFQEIVDLNAVNVAMDGKSQQRAQAWQEKLTAALNSNKARERYVLVGERHLVGILILVFAKEMHLRNIREVYGATVGVGLMGMAGNKGGASIRFKFYDSYLCFVCAHLAAHRENVEGRNSDFANIVQKTVFVGKAFSGEPGAPAPGLGDASEEMQKYFSEVLEVEPTLQTGVSILDHDVVFFMGDLNYRFDESVDTEECFAKIEAQDLEFLRRYDQLNMERSQGRVFVGFQEPVLNFPPTYKYQPGTLLYERRPEKKLRCPAWCDRVLWRAKDPSQVRCLTYRRAELCLSDHKPVAAQLQAKVRMVVKEKRQEVAAEIHRLLDKLENDQHPKVQLEVPGAAALVPPRPPNTIDFGLVRYGVEGRQTLVVTNVSGVAAHFRFVPKLEEESICKHWLSIKPRFGMLLPNESAQITFTALVDLKTAQALNAGQDLLDDILILRLENGQDFFLSVNGTYARSAFGMGLEELTNCYASVRSLPLPAAGWSPSTSAAAATAAASSSSSSKQALGPPTSAGGPALSVPKELWRLIDALYRRGLTEKDLFILPGTPGEVQAVREALDTGDEMDEKASVHSLTEVLLTFLTSLATPVVPGRLLPTIEIDAQNLRPWTRRFLEQLPPVNYNVFVYLISFFREVLKHHESNRLNTDKLATICCKTLLAGNEVSWGGGEDGAGAGPAGGWKGGGEDQRLQSMQLVFQHFLTTSVF